MFHLEAAQVVVDLLSVMVAKLRVPLAQRVQVELRRLDSHRFAPARLLLLELLLLRCEALTLGARPLTGDAHVGRLRDWRNSRPQPLRQQRGKW